MTLETRDKLILTDIDGTVLRWDYHFDQYMKSLGHQLLPDTDREYSVAKRYGLPYSTCMQYVTDFNRSPLIENQRPLADAVEYIGQLADLGFRFVAITAMGNFEESKTYRARGLSRYFGDIFRQVIYLPINSKKTAALEPWANSGLFWIEDHMAHAETGYELGLQSVVINHPYVECYHSDLFPKVSCESPWREIYHMVKSSYGI